MVVALRIPVLLDCREPFPPYHNKHVPLHRLLSIGLIETVEAVPEASPKDSGSLIPEALRRYDHNVTGGCSERAPGDSGCQSSSSSSSSARAAAAAAAAPAGVPVTRHEGGGDGDGEGGTAWPLKLVGWRAPPCRPPACCVWFLNGKMACGEVRYASAALQYKSLWISKQGPYNALGISIGSLKIIRDFKWGHRIGKMAS